MHIRVTHSWKSRNTPGPHVAAVYIPPPTPSAIRYPHPQPGFLQKDAHMHSHMTTFPQPSGPSAAPDPGAQMFPPRCREYGPAFTHLQAHCIHPHTHTDPLTTCHPTPTQLGLKRSRPGGPSQQDRSGPSQLGRKQGYQRPPPFLLPSSFHHLSPPLPPKCLPLLLHCRLCLAPREQPGQAGGLTPGPWG